jgi:hypothetical protein
MTRRRSFAWPLLLVLVCLLANLPARAESTAEHLQRLLWSYGDTGGGWTGGDGTYSVELPDGRIAWLFSDTFLGTVNPDHSRPSSAPFVHNSIVVQDGEHMTTLLPRGARTLIEPPGGAGFYWVGDGIVENGKLLVFVMHFVAAPAPYAFQQIGTAIAQFSLPALQLESVTPLPHAFSAGVGVVPVSYGAALLRDGGYDYVYGVEDLHVDKYLHLARVPAGHLLDQPWQYWTGSEWSDLPVLSTRIMSGVANELSIERIDGSFVLVTQDHAIRPEVMLSTAASPQGPWSGPRPIYTIVPGSGQVTYNAKAHDEFSTTDTLLVTYNVNSTTTQGLYDDVDNYRPRFVEVAIRAA